MELRVLRYFLMVAREENITRAAEQLHITQPTLSRQLQQLEEELNCKLFDRSSHNIMLTEDGMSLKKHAQDIVTLADRTEREFAKKQEIAGEIVFGCGEARCMDDLASYMERFQSMYPQVQYELYTANADDVKERLDKGLVDIGLLSEPVDISKYNFIRLRQKERWGILVAEDTPLAEKEAVTPKDLLSVPLLMTKRTIVKSELESWFGDLFEQIQVAGTYNLLNNAAALVRHHMGAALCYQIGVTYPHLKFIPLVPSLETGFVLVWRKNQVVSNVVESFIQIAKDEICRGSISDTKQ